MPGFFNQDNKFRQAMQVYNLIVAGLATYDLITNPESSFSEVGMDIAIHLLTAVSFRGNDLTLVDLGTAALNFSRIGAIYGGLTSGCSSVSTLLNSADIANHLVNAGTSLFGYHDDEQLENEEQHVKLS